MRQESNNASVTCEDQEFREMRSESDEIIIVSCIQGRPRVWLGKDWGKTRDGR